MLARRLAGRTCNSPVRFQSASYTLLMNELVHRNVLAARGRAKEPARETTRTNDPERTKANIMDVAAAEFGEKGLAGARIDEIAAATQAPASG